MTLAPEWTLFVEEYSSSDSYWYVPKGGTADKPALREQFRIFDLFEGDVWSPELQRSIGAELRAEGLSDGSDALPRQIKRVFENLGLCWIGEGEPIRVTPAGRAYLGETTDRSAILDRQVWRYQLPSPVNATAATLGIELHPHAFLAEAILECGGEISGREFVLFVSRARTHADITKVVGRVAAWRALPTPAQVEILIALRNSNLGTIQRDHSYAMAFHHCDLLLDRGRNGLSVGGGNIDSLRRRVDEHKGASEIIRFENEPDCIAFYGDPEHRGTQLEALDYYIDVSDVEKARDVYTRLPRAVRSEATPDEFQEEQFLEKHLEDYLEMNLGQVEPGLTLLGRQYATKVGPIDLFARSKGGDLVVLELKKGRASDKVFGQICRYMGSIKSEQVGGHPAVRGYIVGREVDLKLQYALRVLESGVMGLKTFTFQGEKGAEDWIQVSAV